MKKRRWHEILNVVLAMALALMMLPLFPEATPVEAAGENWLSGWDKRVNLTIDQADIDAALSNFPILVYISASSGINSEDLSFVFDELTQDANRKKIAVTTDDGETECYVEIEKWDDANEKAWLWVKVPSIASGAATDLYLYYDSAQDDNDTYVGDTGDAVAENVWDDDFVAVYHLAETDIIGAGKIKDSTANGYNGTAVDLEGDEQVAGKIDGSLYFDGSGEEIATGTMSHNIDTGEFTLSAWVNATTIGSYDGLMMIGTWEPAFYVEVADEWGLWFNGAAKESGSTLSADQWYYLVVERDGTTISFYENSVKTPSSVEEGATVPNDVFYIGDAGGEPLDGIADEVRVSKVSREAEWIKASYETGRDHLLDWGSEEDTTAAEITAFSFAEQTGAATINSGASTIDIEVYYGTDVTGLVATFTTSPVITSIKVGATAQVSGTTANNFSSPVTYDVIAQDGTTTKNWVVTVTVAAVSTAAEITAFSFAEQTGAATINSGASTIDIEVAEETDVTGLVATFTTSPVITSIKVDATAQVSGTTANNFSSPVTYDVIAQDGTTTKNWVVTVTVFIVPDVYAIVYAGDGDDGFLKTVMITDDGNIVETNTNTPEFDTKKGNDPDIINISGTIFAIAYAGDGDDGFLKTVDLVQESTIWPATVFHTKEDGDPGGEEPVLVVEYIPLGGTEMQTIEWIFEPDLDFDYGQERTLSFSCRVVPDDDTRYWNAAIIQPNDSYTGLTANITIGNPPDTGIPGSGATVTKTADPEVVYAGIPTLVTYVISITNNDTGEFSKLDFIEDYLPVGFSYVVDSATLEWPLHNSEDNPAYIDYGRYYNIGDFEPDFKDDPSGRLVLKWHKGASANGLFPGDNELLHDRDFPAGVTYTQTFQASANVSVSGNYPNEVFVKLKDWNLYGDRGLGQSSEVYSWPTGEVVVPAYDILTETEHSILRANAAISLAGIEIRSWHWKKHK